MAQEFFKQFEEYCKTPGVDSGKAHSYAKAIEYLCDYLNITKIDEQAVSRIKTLESDICDKNNTFYGTLLSFLTGRGQKSYLESGYIQAALKYLFTFFEREAGEIEKAIDATLASDISDVTIDSSASAFVHKGKPKKRTSPVEVKGHKTYPRDRNVALNALSYAGYVCEVDKNHESFIRKNSNEKYTEPHHLIPMRFSDEFEHSLDVEENIVSLCSNCHNQIHYGRDAHELIEKLYEQRKVLLKKVGLEITLAKLLRMYGIE